MLKGPLQVTEPVHPTQEGRRESLVTLSWQRDATQPLLPLPDASETNLGATTEGPGEKQVPHVDPGLRKGKEGEGKRFQGTRSQRSEDGSSSGLSIKTCKDKKKKKKKMKMLLVPAGEGDMETPSCEARMGLDSTCSSKGRRARARRMSS